MRSHLQGQFQTSKVFGSPPLIAGLCSQGLSVDQAMHLIYVYQSHP